MHPQKPLLTLVIALLWLTTALGATVVRPELNVPSANAQFPVSATLLLDSARWWKAQDRADLAVIALRKLLLSNPDQAEALMLLAELQWDQHQEKAFQTLKAHLQHVAEHSQQYSELCEFTRIQTQEKQQLLHIELLAKAGNYHTAALAMRQLLPNGPPEGELALRYYQVLGNDSRFWTQAVTGLQHLVQAIPGDPSYRNALAQLLLLRKTTAAQGVQQIAQLVQSQQIPQTQGAALWRQAVLTLDAVPAHRRPVQAYLRRFPHDTDAIRLLARINAATAHTAALRTLFPEAVLKTHPDEANAWGELGRIALQRSDYPEAVRCFTHALRVARNDAEKWHSLLNTARFWGLLHEARQARLEQHYGQSRQLLDTALTLNPGQEEALTQYAQLEDAEQHWPQAERFDRQILATHPDNTRALSSLLHLLQAQQRWNELQQLLVLYRQQQHLALPVQSLIDGAQLSWLQQQADFLETHRQFTQAAAVLEQAIALDSHSPWLRFRLAKLYLHLGKKSQAWALMSVLSPTPANPTSIEDRFAYALFLSNQNQTATALAIMQAIPESERSLSMQQFWRRLQADDLLQQLHPHSGIQPAPERISTLLHQAQSLVANNIDLSYPVAREISDQGQPTAAIAWLQSALQAAAPSEKLSWQLAIARLLNHQENDPQLASAITPLLSHLKQLTDAQSVELMHIRHDLALRQISQSLKRKDFSGAQAQLTNALLQTPESADLLRLQAVLYTETGQRDKARLYYVGILQHDPANISARLDLFDLDRPTMRPDAARQALQSIAGLLPKNDWANQLAIARRYLHAGEVQAAEHLLPAPDSTHPLWITRETLILQAQIAESRGSWTQAIIDYRQAAALQPPSTPPGQAEQALSRIAERRDGYITSGFSLYDKAGSNGTSTSAVREIPTFIYLPLGYSGHLFAHLDQVDYQAGRLAPDNYSQNQFGQLYNRSTASSYTPFESATGMAPGIGYETEHLRMDIGSSPLGFPTQNVVGGIKFSGSTANAYGSINIARRPVDNSLLSYAGAQDPLTHQWWGGVVSTGLDGRIGQDLGTLSTFFSGGLHVLTGTQVLRNEEMDLSGGFNHDISLTDRQVFTTGLQYTFWRFQYNLDNFTYGQGGYYSPQSYLALTWPLRLSGKFERWSYRLSGSLGISRAATAAIAYYPTDAAAQYFRMGQNNASPPVYAASPASNSLSWSLESALEYRVAAHWFIGSSLGLERSPYYTPNFATFYFRYELTAKSSPMTTLPRPVTPYADF